MLFYSCNMDTYVTEYVMPIITYFFILSCYFVSSLVNCWIIITKRISEMIHSLSSSICVHCILLAWWLYEYQLHSYFEFFHLMVFSIVSSLCLLLQKAIVFCVDWNRCCESIKWSKAKPSATSLSFKKANIAEFVSFFKIHVLVERAHFITTVIVILL